MAEDSLRCSLTDLVVIFRKALIASIPTAERLLLNWEDENQHRDWERLSTTLFDVCVRGPVESDSKGQCGEYSLPPYDIDSTSYAEFSWVGAADVKREAPAVLIRLLTDRNPFDTAQFAILHPGSLIPIDWLRLPIAEVDFVYVRRSRGRPDVETRKIEAID